MIKCDAFIDVRGNINVIIIVKSLNRFFIFLKE